ncbi:hypothetical protein [Bradyrhizobium sp. AZCC 1721]|uniref:hypothetical protein n=1 Tax=Bradyrhizobium sp. AZCC 1721 TaxID=3117016 RepID=UPI002FF181A7
MMAVMEAAMESAAVECEPRRGSGMRKGRPCETAAAETGSCAGKARAAADVRAANARTAAHGAGTHPAAEASGVHATAETTATAGAHAAASDTTATTATPDSTGGVTATTAATHTASGVSAATTHTAAATLRERRRRKRQRRTKRSRDEAIKEPAVHLRFSSRDWTIATNAVAGGRRSSDANDPAMTNDKCDSF